MQRDLTHKILLVVQTAFTPAVKAEAPHGVWLQSGSVYLHKLEEVQRAASPAKTGKLITNNELHGLVQWLSYQASITLNPQNLQLFYHCGSFKMNRLSAIKAV